MATIDFSSPSLVFLQKATGSSALDYPETQTMNAMRSAPALSANFGMPKTLAHTRHSPAVTMDAAIVNDDADG